MIFLRRHSALRSGAYPNMSTYIGCQPYIPIRTTYSLFDLGVRLVRRKS